MADKPDIETIYKQQLEEYKSHTGRDVDPATAAALRKGLEDASKTPVQTEEISLKRDAAIIADSTTREGLSVASGMLGFPGDIIHGARGLMGFDVAENPFLGSTYINKNLTAGYEGAVRLTGHEPPKPATEREKGLASAMETTVDVAAMASAVRGGLLLLEKGGKWLMGKMGSKALLSAAAGEKAAGVASGLSGATKTENAAASAASTANKTEDALKSAKDIDNSTLFPRRMQSAPEVKSANPVLEQPAQASGSAAGGTASKTASTTAEEAGVTAGAAEETASAGASAQASWWQRMKYRNNFLTYMSMEKKEGDLAQKLETLAQRTRDYPDQKESTQYWINLLADKRRISGVTPQEMAQIQSKRGIPQEVKDTFQEIAERNNWTGMTGKLFRGKESMGAQLDFIKDHPYITALETGSLYFKPASYVMKHGTDWGKQAKGLGIAAGAFGAEHLVTGDNYITGGWARSYVWLGNKAIDGAIATGKTALPAIDNGLAWTERNIFSMDGVDATLSGAPVSHTGRMLYSAAEGAEKHIVDGTTNVTLSTLDQMGFKLDEVNVRNNVAWGMDRFGITKVFGAVTAMRALNEAQNGDPDTPFVNRFAEAFAKAKIGGVEEDISQVAAVAPKRNNGGTNLTAHIPAVKDIASKAETLTESLIEQIPEAEPPPAPQMLARVEEGAKKLKDKAKQPFEGTVEELQHNAAALAEEANKKGKQVIDTTKGIAMAGMLPDLGFDFKKAGDYFTNMFSNMFKPIKDMFTGGGIEGSTMLKIGLTVLSALALGSLAGNNRGMGMVMGLVGMLAMGSMLFGDADAEAEQTAENEHERRGPMAPTPS